MARGFSLQDIADKTGIRKPALSLMERGKQQIGVDDLELLLDALGITHEDYRGDPPRAAAG